MIHRTMAIVLGVVLSVPALGGVARSEILAAELRVHGLSCPFCAFGIEKKLLAVDGVTQVEVLLDEGRLRLRLEDGNTATTADLASAVEQAGFELAGLAIEVRGILEVGPGGTWLQAHDGLRLRLLELDGETEKPLTPSSRRRLQEAGQDRVIASGRVPSAREQQPRLIVELPGAALHDPDSAGLEMGAGGTLFIPRSAEP